MEDDLKWKPATRKLVERKRRLDILTFVVTFPVLAAYGWDIYHGSRSDLPDWIEPYIIPWCVAFVAVLIARSRLLNCPRCLKSVRVGADRLFLTPLPGACRHCGLVLGGPKTDPRLIEKAPVRPGLLGVAVAVLVVGVAGLTRNIGMALGVGAVFGGFLWAVGKARSAIPKCPSCGQQSATGDFCSACGTALPKPGSTL